MRILIRIIPILLGLAILFLAPLKVFAAEQIDNYEIYIKVNQDSELNITEKIQYNFGTDQRHGIYREIPDSITNKDDKKFKLEINVSEIIHNNDRSIPYTKSSEDEKLIIKIGDPDKTITGLNTYIISYRVKGAVTYFEDHDELYWNAIGTNWNVPILKSNVIVDLSDLENLTAENTSVICFTGQTGSTNQNCGYSKNLPNIAIFLNKFLSSYEGLTFAISVPRDTIAYYEPQEYRSAWLTSGPGLWFLFSSALNVLLSIVIFILWLKYGRDPKDDRVLVRMYDAPKDSSGRDLSPIEMGTIVDEYLHSQDLSAEIIGLAVNKYIIIEEKETFSLGPLKSKEIILHQGPKLKEDLTMSKLKLHQVDLIKALGLDSSESVNPSQDTLLPIKIQQIQKDVYKQLTKEGYFPENPESIRQRYSIIGFVLLFTTLFIPAVIFLYFSFFMSRKTLKGLAAKRHALGLKQFLQSQDRQFEFQEKNFYLFEKLLPYAINFGVAKIWAKKFEDLYAYKPDWYTSNSVSNFNTYSLVNSLQNNLRSVEGSYSYRSSSSSGFSGGGSSGGGGGGGGGGSW